MCFNLACLVLLYSLLFLSHYASYSTLFISGSPIVLAIGSALHALAVCCTIAWKVGGRCRVCGVSGQSDRQVHLHAYNCLSSLDYFLGFNSLAKLHSLRVSTLRRGAIFLDSRAGTFWHLVLLLYDVPCETGRWSVGNCSEAATTQQSPPNGPRQDRLSPVASVDKLLSFT